MAAKTDPINTSNPAGTSDPKQGDDHIRTLAKALIELLNVDHYVGVENPWGSDASGDETGEHKKVTFHAAISDPTVASGDGVLYIKGDPPELYFRDEYDGNVIQVTSGGEILFASLSPIAHDTYLSGVDVAGTSTIALIKAGTGDVPWVGAGAVLSTSGDPTAAAGIACKEYADKTPKAQMKADNVAGAAFGAGSESSTEANGRITKCGSGTVAPEGTVDVDFADAFPGGILAATATITTNLTPSETVEAISIITKSTTKLTIENGDGVEHTFDWIAIGY